MSGPDAPAIQGPKAQAALEVLKAELAAGRYRFESRPCFCGAADGTLLAERDRYGLRHSLVCCRRCGLLRAEARMDQAATVDSYARRYRALYGDEDADPAERWKVRLAEGRAVHAFVRRHLDGSLNLVLDVGCNLGTMLLPLADEGAAVFGVDYGGEYARLGRERTGLKDLYEGGVDVFLATGRRADLVICSHSVEHFLDLESELSKLDAALAPGGRLLVIAPGLDRYTEFCNRGNFLGLLQNAHTFQFTPTTLEYVFECMGFRREASDNEMRALFVRADGPRRSKSTVPTGEHDRTVAYLRAVERRYLPYWHAKRALDALGPQSAAQEAPGAMSRHLLAESGAQVAELRARLVGPLGRARPLDDEGARRHRSTRSASHAATARCACG